MRLPVGLLLTCAAWCEAQESPVGPTPKKGRFEALKAFAEKDRSKDKASTHGEVYRYLDHLIRTEYKLIYDKAKNPRGPICAWYYLPFADQKKRAVEDIEQQLKKDPLEDSAATWLDSLEQALPRRYVIRWAAHTRGGGGEPRGCLLADASILGLGSEEEVFTVLDLVGAFSGAMTHGMKFAGQEMEMKDMAHARNGREREDLALLHAVSTQFRLLHTVRKGAAPRFAEEVADLLAASYRSCGEVVDLAKEKHRELELESCARQARTFDAYLKLVDEDLRKLGFRVYLGKVEKLEADKK